MRPFRLALPLLLAAAIVTATRAQDGVLAQAEFAAPLEAATHGIGAVVPDLRFVDIDGKPGRLSDFKDRSALVIVIRDVGCPVSKKYGLRTAEIEREAAALGAAFLYLNPTPNDDADECREEMAKYGFTGRYAIETEGRFGWHLKVKTTCEVFVLDRTRTLRFRGPIDDQIGRGATRAQISHHYLRDAIAAVAKGEAVAAPAMSAPGCLLEFLVEPPPEPPLEPPPADAPAAAPPPLAWYGRIEALAQQRCQGCHYSGGPGPFTLTSVDDFAGAATMVREAIVGGIMPPWYATPESGPFLHDLRLTADEKRDLLQWLADGCKAGDPALALPPRKIASGWTIGEPDLIVASPKTVDIPASGVVDYIDVMAPTGLKEDVWVEAIQILCEHPTICHHVLAIAQYPESQRQEFIDSYLPGREATVFPPGHALLLGKGAVIRFNLHYTPDGTPVKERTRIGFKFAKEKPQQRVSGQIVRSYEIDIPPNARHHAIVSEFRFPFDAFIRRMVPHMHLRGKAVQVELVHPDGSTTLPLELATWHPDWQFAYEFVEPIKVRRGTLVRCTNYYDNSAENPFNPDPKKRVGPGPQIWDEMAGVFVEWFRSADAPSARDRPRDPEKVRRAKMRAQKNGSAGGSTDEGDDGGGDAEGDAGGW